MADNDVLVTISGAALSLLLYENVRSTGDQMGLLLGDVLTFITKNVTDCDRQVEHVKHHINIDTIVLCSKEILKDGLGSIDPERLESLIKNKEKYVVGWFRFRRHNFLLPTMRDKIMHKEFASHFSRMTGASEEHFILFLLNASTTSQYKGTHKYRHVCLQYKQGIFPSVPLRINNLGDDAARHDGSDYKPVPQKKYRDDDYFSQLMKDIKIKSVNCPSADVVTAIQKRAEQYLERIMTDVCISDEEISELQHQVDDLRARLQESAWMKNSRLEERSAEPQLSRENERILTTAQIHDSPRSTNSDDMFGPDSPNLIPLSVSKKMSADKTKPLMIVNETRNHSSENSNFCELIPNESSPEGRNKESAQKLMNRISMEERSPMSRRQTSSPKNSGRKAERRSLTEFSSHGQDETPGSRRKEQSPRPTSFPDNRV